MLTVSLANILIFNDDSLTPWTNISLVGVPGIKFFNNNSNYGYAISADASINRLADAINNMTFNFTFDWAVAIVRFIKNLLVYLLQCI